jgi:hypothetical protein
VRKHGASDQAIADAIHVCVLFNIANRCADALGFEIAPGFTPVSQRLTAHGYTT